MSRGTRHMPQGKKVAKCCKETHSSNRAKKAPAHKWRSSHCAPATQKITSMCKDLAGVARQITIDKSTHVSPRLHLLQRCVYRVATEAAQEAFPNWNCLSSFPQVVVEAAAPTPQLCFGFSIPLCLSSCISSPFFSLSELCLLFIPGCPRRSFYWNCTCPHRWRRLPARSMCFSLLLVSLTLQSPFGLPVIRRNRLLPILSLAQLHHLDDIMSDTFAPTGIYQQALDNIQFYSVLQMD